MKRIRSLFCAACTIALLLTGCKDSSAGEPFTLDSASEITETTTTTTARTTASATETTTYTETAATKTETTVPEEMREVIGKWVLDSVVQDGTVRFRDTAYTPPINYRQLVQVEFKKDGTFERLHPLYGYTETGTWTHIEEDERIIRVTLPYDTFFYNTSDPLDFYFENYALFIKAPPGGADYYFERVSSFPAPPTERAAAGRARMSIAGFWECAWITADGETYTDELDGVKIPTMKFVVLPEGNCRYYTGNDPKTERAYSTNYLSDNTMELLLARSPNANSTIGQVEGTVYKQKNFLIWRYDDHTVMSFRSITEDEFMTALYPDEYVSVLMTTTATSTTTRTTTSTTHTTAQPGSSGSSGSTSASASHTTKTTVTTAAEQ